MYEKRQWKDFSNEANEKSMQDNKIQKMLANGEIKEFITNNGDKITIGNWYRSRREHLFLICELCKDGYALAISHISGNKIRVPPEQLYFASPAEAPKIPPGMILAKNSNDNQNNSNDKTETYQHLYERYPNIVAGSIYRIKKANTRQSKKPKGSPRGETRCKIICQVKGCDNKRDIKVQDAFQVKRCEKCQKEHARKRKR